MRLRQIYIAGYGLLGAGVVSDATLSWLGHDFRSVGVLAGITGVIVVFYVHARRAFDLVNRPADEAFTEGWEAGYDKGWREGRQRPKLVAIRPTRESSNAVD